MYYITIYENNMYDVCKKSTQGNIRQIKKVFSFWAVKTQIQVYKGCLLNYC